MLIEFWQENKKILLAAAMATAMVIGVCWLFFDFHIVKKVRKVMGYPPPMLVIMDEAAFASYKTKVLPIVKKHSVPIGIMVEPWAFGQKGRMTPQEICQLPMEKYLALPHIKKDNPLLNDKKLLQKWLEGKKEQAGQAGLLLEYVVYAWDGNNVKAMKRLVPNLWMGAICKNSRPKVNVNKDGYQLQGYVVGYNKIIGKDDLLRFVEMIDMQNGFGILMIRSYNKFFTNASQKALEAMINYAKENEVQIVTLHEAMENYVRN